MKLDSIREDFAGEIVLPDDPGYDQARAVWNGMADRRPALVVSILPHVQAFRHHRFPGR